MPSSSYVSYEEAAQWYQAEGVTTVAELTARAKQGLPDWISSHPGRVYREEFKAGGYGRFLGTDRIAPQNRKWVSYEEASRWYQAEGVTTQVELTSRANKGLPDGIPSDPYDVYREEFKDGGLKRFLGTGECAAPSVTPNPPMPGAALTPEPQPIIRSIDQHAPSLPSSVDLRPARRRMR